MLNPALLIVCAPLLLWQGRKVRRTTLRLPEASGARSGVLGQGQPLRLLILGDSAAAGVGVAEQHQALAGQLAAQLSVRHRLTWQLQASTGLTCGQLLAKLEPLVGQQYDCVVLSIGVNDVTTGTSAELWLVQLQALFARLRADFNVQHIVISAIPPMQHFTALPRPLSDYLGRRAQRLNQVTAHLADQYDDLSFMPIDLALAPEMLAQDGFHPSALAYGAWADQVAARIMG